MKIIGHRGAKAVSPENTLESIDIAIQAGVYAVEFDVRVTLDGIPVLCHDKTVSTTDNKHVEVAMYKFSELQKLHPGIPSLEAALHVIGAQTIPCVEIKSGVTVGPIVNVLKRFIGHTYEATGLTIGSKSQAILREIHQTLPDVPLIVIEPWSGVRGNLRARQVGAKQVFMNQIWLWPGFIRAVSKHYELFAYTINDPAKAKRWEKSGLAGVITDDPQAMITALKERQ